MLATMWSNSNSHSSLVGTQNGTATLEDSLAVYNKIKYTLTVQFSDCAPWQLHK